VTQRTERPTTYGVGDELPAITKALTQDEITRYAEASGDRNPLHIDAAFAATTQFGGTIAHGMLVLAYIVEMVATAFGDAWPRSGRLKVRFRGAARPGDTVRAGGRITGVADGKITCEVECRNQDGESLITGEASVRTR
jgi:3-hydroxybutyryl-CoA dehydratase